MLPCFKEQERNGRWLVQSKTSVYHLIVGVHVYVSGVCWWCVGCIISGHNRHVLRFGADEIHKAKKEKSFEWLLSNTECPFIEVAMYGKLNYDLSCM